MEIQNPKAHPEVSLQRIGSEAILHDQRNGRAHVINEPAARIWELCNGQAGLDQITDAFALSYRMQADQVREDVVYILNKFQALGLLD